MNNLLFSLATGGKSLIEELWDYFAENYLSGSASYENLGLSGNSIISVPVILAGIIIGAIIAVFAAMRDNRVMGGFVRTMLDRGAVGKENSLLLGDVGIDVSSSVARALRKSVGLRRIVHCVEEEDFYASLREAREEHEKRREEDPSLPEFKHTEYTFCGTEHFYIAEDQTVTAEVKYTKRTIKPWVLPIVVVVSIISFFALIIVLPYVLELFDQLFGSFKSV